MNFENPDQGIDGKVLTCLHTPIVFTGKTILNRKSFITGISAFDSKLFDTVSNGFPLLYIIGFLHGRTVAENGGHILRHI